MTLDEEITAVEAVVHAANSAATEHLERATRDLKLGGTVLAHYKDFLNASLLNARSIMAWCLQVQSTSTLSAEASVSLVQSLLASVRESIRLMYVAMAFLEQCAGPTPPDADAPAPEREALRSCSFCGKPETESRLVAGPVANICASCTRLACGVLGIALSDIKTE
jgi:hypothetical protein